MYIPHVLAVGGKVIGFLPGYLQQEGYTSGVRFGIIGLFVTGRLAIVVAALIMAAAAFAVLQFTDPDRPWEGAVVMTATALAVATPHYQWYSLLLVMLVALDGRPEWLAFAAGGYYAAEPSMGRFTVPYRFHEAVAYGVPVLVVAAGWLVRHELARRGLGTTGPVPVTATPVTATPVTATPVPATPVPAAPVPAGRSRRARSRRARGPGGRGPGGRGPAGAVPAGAVAAALAAIDVAPQGTFDGFSPQPQRAGHGDGGVRV